MKDLKKIMKVYNSKYGDLEINYNKIKYEYIDLYSENSTLLLDYIELLTNNKFLSFHMIEKLEKDDLDKESLLNLIYLMNEIIKQKTSCNNLEVV